jgi:hypothetical protein
MVFLAFISVKFETSKFSRVHICVKIYSLLNFLQSLSKMLQIIRYNSNVPSKIIIFRVGVDYVLILITV